MFEKEAEEYADKDFGMYEPTDHERYAKETDWRNGAEFGYNKANEWQFVSEKGLPKESGRYLVYVGGEEKGVYPLDFETEYNDFGYWCLIINSASLGVTDEYGNEYVVAVAFKNKIPGYEPFLCNLGHMFKNYGMKVVYRNPFRQIFMRFRYFYYYKVKKFFRRMNKNRIKYYNKGENKLWKMNS